MQLFSVFILQLTDHLTGCSSGNSTCPEDDYLAITNRALSNREQLISQAISNAKSKYGNDKDKQFENF